MPPSTLACLHIIHSELKIYKWLQVIQLFILFYFVLFCFILEIPLFYFIYFIYFMFMFIFYSFLFTNIFNIYQIIPENVLPTSPPPPLAVMREWKTTSEVYKCTSRR